MRLLYVRIVLSFFVFSLINTNFIFSETPARKSSGDNRIHEQAVKDLINRWFPSYAGSFQIQTIPAENNLDVFEIESNGDKIVLSGNNGISLASALGYYLKNYCHLDISWNGSNLEMPAKLPVVAEKIHKSSPYKYRYYLNYCTFNYSMSWWNWERWQWEIDWMALNGINMPLAITGEEAIWQKVYNKLGFNNNELGSFFTGPAYFSWLWMGNIDKWGGPLPQHWMDTHKDLQKKILERERSFGMKPVLPAFTGHVPPSFKEKFPKAKLKQTNWDAGFEDTYILDPEDPMFETIGTAFITEQTKEYGTDHFYSADTFNENVPHTRDSTYLSEMSQKVYRSMATADTAAVWVMQGWMFSYNSSYWQPTQIKALLGAVPDNNMIVLDLWSETHPIWNRSEAYYGKQWIWNMLHNFGGNVSMFGRMRHVASDPSIALHDPESKNMVGIGLTPEGIEQNPALYALMLENVWRSEPIDVSEWLKDYSFRRYGKKNEKINDGWEILKNTVYSGGPSEGGQESIISARPTFNIRAERINTKLTYDPLELVKAWDIFINCSDDLKDSEGFKYDVVDVTRQVLANYATPLQQKCAKAYLNKDIKAFKLYSTQFIELINDMDALLATREDFLLGKWIADSRSWGITEEEKNIYEFNARDLVTLWGDKNSPLHEYSNRQWSGLMNGFYKPRWEAFFKQITQSLSSGKSFNAEAFDIEIKDWEWKWVNSHDPYPAKVKGNPLETAKKIYNKYYPKVKLKEA
jgi:alpha-N-acetylglucosaminidase